MKKLMFAVAAAALTGVASAALCDEVINPTLPDGCALYNVKFTFKTLALKKGCSASTVAGLTVKEVGYPNPNTGKGSQSCQDQLVADDKKTAKNDFAYLDNATRTFDGIIWQCKLACVDNSDAFKNEEANFALWEKKSRATVAKAVYTAPNEAAKTSAKWAGETAQNHDKEMLNFSALYRYGAKANKVAAYWSVKNGTAGDIAFECEAAGFGTYDAKTMIAKSISGNAVAKIQPLGIDTTKQEDCYITTTTSYIPVVANLCAEWSSWCCCPCVIELPTKAATGAYVVPASGTWSIKYNASASKNGKLSKIVPNWAIVTPN